MAKLTLLEIVQDTLNDLDSDAVNSINDTVESQQIAQIAKTAYFELIGNRNWPHLRKLIQLESLSDTVKPNFLKIPVIVKEMVTFSYDTFTTSQPNVRLKEVVWKEPDAFLRMVSTRNSSLPTVSTIIDFSGTKLLIVNNVHPTYYTSFDDVYLVTDSYDSAVDDTLQSSKTQCLAYAEPDWVHTDAGIPNLPIEAFPALLAEVKSAAFLNLKQTINQKAEQKASRQNKWLSRKAWTAKGGIQYENYGRRGRV